MGAAGAGGVAGVDLLAPLRRHLFRRLELLCPIAIRCCGSTCSHWRLFWGWWSTTLCAGLHTALTLFGHAACERPASRVYRSAWAAIIGHLYIARSPKWRARRATARVPRLRVAGQRKDSRLSGVTHNHSPKHFCLFYMVLNLAKLCSPEQARPTAHHPEPC